MAFHPGSDSMGFLGTLNRLSGMTRTPGADTEQVKRMILQQLQEGPADLKRLAELSLPMSAVEAGTAELQQLGLIEPVPDADRTFRLTEYAAKALTYIAPT